MINIFNIKSKLYAYRWFIVCTTLVLVFMLYHTLYGGRMFTSGRQQQWSSSGPGYHK